MLLSQETKMKGTGVCKMKYAILLFIYFYTYADRNTAETRSVIIYEILEGQKQHNDNKWGNLKYKYRNRAFGCRGYYDDTAGKNMKAIVE